MIISRLVFLNYLRCPKYCTLVQQQNLNYEGKLKDFSYEIFQGENIEFTALMKKYMKALDSEVLKKIPGDTEKIFKKILRSNLYVARPDIFVENDKNYHVIEIKGTSTKKFLEMKLRGTAIFVKAEENKIVLKESLNEDVIENENYRKLRGRLFDKNNEIGKYIYDIAWNYYVSKSSLNMKPVKCSLALFNSEYVLEENYSKKRGYPQNKNGAELIAFIDVTTIMNEYCSIIEKDIEILEEYLKKQDSNYSNIGPFCDKDGSRECQFIEICWRKIPKNYSIFDFTSSHNGFIDKAGKKNDIFQMINEKNMFEMLDVPGNYLKRYNNIIQYNALLSKVTYIDKMKIKKGIATLEKPYYYLDFETFPCPFPRFRGESPFTQSVFQYSLYKEEKHFEFLATSHKDCRKELLEKLLNEIDLSTGGTVITYNKRFEGSILKRLAEIFPEYKKKIEIITDEKYFFDLLYLIRGNKEFYRKLQFTEEESRRYCYYNYKMQGSFSLKSVLPCFESDLYKDLEIKNGLMAALAYVNKNDLKLKRKKLLEYCKIDTLAMVKIMEHLKKESE